MSNFGEAMSQPIEYKRLHLSTGEKTKRHRQHKAQIITVHSGTILIRLGKSHVSLAANQSAWLPHECLHSIECADNCLLDILFFSARVTSRLSDSFAKLPTSALFNALINEISDTALNSGSTEFCHLLQVCLDQLHKLSENSL
ncbi:MAG: hypothetical protein ACI86X_001880 [Moritella sp.]|jgi:hypothetical protein